MFNLKVHPKNCTSSESEDDIAVDELDIISRKSGPRVYSSM